MSMIVGPVNPDPTEVVMELPTGNYQGSNNPYYLNMLLTPGITQTPSGQLTFAQNGSQLGASMMTWIQQNWLMLTVGVIAGSFLFRRV